MPFSSRVIHDEYCVFVENISQFIEEIYSDIDL